MNLIDKIQTQRVLLPSVFKYSRVHLIKQVKNVEIDYNTLNLGISLPNKASKSKQKISHQKGSKLSFSNRVRNSVNYDSKKKLDKVNRSSANLELNKLDSIIQCRRNITQFQEGRNQIVQIKIKNSLKNKHLQSLQLIDVNKSQKELRKFIQENKIKFKQNFSKKKYFDIQQVKNGKINFNEKNKIQLSVHSIKSVIRKKSKFQKYSQINISEMLLPIEQKNHQHKRRKSLGKKITLTSIYGKKKTITQQKDYYSPLKQKKSIFNRPETEMNAPFLQGLNPWQSIAIQEQKDL